MQATTTTDTQTDLTRFGARFGALPPDTSATNNAPVDHGGKIPGSLWRHTKTGGWYWSIASRFVPADVRGRGARTHLPLIPTGKKTATTSRTLAERCQKRLWRDWQAAGASIAVKSIADKVAEFQAFNRLHASVDHAAYNASIVRDFLAARQIRREREIDKTHVSEYLASVQNRPSSPRTVQAYRGALNKFCKWLGDELDSNPVAAVHVAEPDKLPPRFLTDAQISMLLERARDIAEPWLYHAVCLALYCGGRLGSLQALQWLHVQPGGLVVPLPKTGDYAIVPFGEPILGDELRTTLAGIRPGRPTDYILPVHDPRWYGEVLADLTRGLPVFGELPGTRAGNQWHLLRATWTVNCARRGATIWQLMAWGGWKIPTTVMRYVNIARAAGMDAPHKGLQCEKSYSFLSAAY